MAKTALIAQITGEAYRHMLDWRNTIDLQLIQSQLDDNGEALVIMFMPKHGMRRITELPALGTARPHTSSFGGGYKFCIRLLKRLRGLIRACNALVIQTHCSHAAG